MFWAEAISVIDIQIANMSVLITEPDMITIGLHDM